MHENIFRHMENGPDAMTASRIGTKEISWRCSPPVCRSS
ncbi:MAG: hypothetical protein U1D30_18675 [Planctomycetota bacterium]